MNKLYGEEYPRDIAAYSVSYDKALMIIIVIFVMVLFLEQVLAIFRKALI